MFDDTEQDVDALGRGQGSIKVVVGEIRIRETIVQLRNSFHLLNVPHWRKTWHDADKYGAASLATP
jgi:hypothetical protein